MLNDHSEPYIESNDNPKGIDLITIYFPYYLHRFEDCYQNLMVKYNKTIKMLTLFTGMQIIDNSTIKFKDRPSKPFITLYSYYCKGIKKYRNKLRIYLYQEFNKPPYITNDWIFKSHYCIEKLGSPTDGFDEPYNGWSHLIFDDGGLKYFIARVDCVVQIKIIILKKIQKPYAIKNIIEQHLNYLQNIN